jgi:hypothetical protein
LAATILNIAMIRQLISQHTEASFMAVGAVSRPATTSLSIAVPRPTTKDIPSISTLRRIPELDGLRGIAILLVLLWHAVFQIQPHSTLLTRILSLGSLSWSGVDLFFVLSGFLIGGILLDEKHSPRYFETFYARRAYRILPLYALLLVSQIVTRDSRGNTLKGPYCDVVTCTSFEERFSTAGP